MAIAGPSLLALALYLWLNRTVGGAYPKRPVAPTASPSRAELVATVAVHWWARQQRRGRRQP